MGLSGSSVAFGCFRLQQPCRCSAGAHRAQAAQPAAGSRCSCGAGGHGARAAAAPLSECVPGLHGGRAAGDDRAETPGPLLRRRARLGGVPGQPVPAAGLSEFGRGSHAGGAGWGGGTAHSCRCPCPRGAAIAGAPCRWGSRWRFAAPVGERRAGFAAMPHLTKGSSPCPEGAAERRRGMVRRWAERRPSGRRKAQGIPAAIGVAAAANFPHREAGGVQGGRSLLPCAWAGVTKREGEPARLSLLLLSKADRVTVGQVWGCPPPPLGKVLYIGHMQHRGETIQGFHPCTPSSHDRRV